MPQDKKISAAVISRLPRYYRYLGDLLDEGITKISSKALSIRMGTTASQIRQDLNCFGGFGQQGYGYNVKKLQDEIAEILGLNKHYKAILLGAGKLGSALMGRITFSKRGFELVGIFDIDPEIIGTSLYDYTVLHIDQLEEFCKKHHPSVAFLALPREIAPEIAVKCEELGVKGFWNFSAGYIKLQDPTIPVENVHLGDSLMTLSCKMTQRNQKKREL